MNQRKTLTGIGGDVCYEPAIHFRLRTRWGTLRKGRNIQLRHRRRLLAVNLIPTHGCSSFNLPFLYFMLAIALSALPSAFIVQNNVLKTYTGFCMIPWTCECRTSDGLRFVTPDVSSNRHHRLLVHPGLSSIRRYNPPKILSKSFHAFQLAERHLYSSIAIVYDSDSIESDTH